MLEDKDLSVKFTHNTRESIIFKKSLRIKFGLWKFKWRFGIIFQKRKFIISIHPGPSSAKNIDIEAIDTFVTKDALILICYAKGTPEALSHKIDFENIIGLRNISQINNRNEETKNIHNPMQE